jgi:hypothetical protein
MQRHKENKTTSYRNMTSTKVRNLTAMNTNDSEEDEIQGTQKNDYQMINKIKRT